MAEVTPNQLALEVLDMADLKDRMKSGIDAAADKAKNATEKAADMAGSAKEEGQGLAERAGEMAGQAREKLREWAGDAKESAQHAGEKVQQWAGDAYDVTRDKVSDFSHEVTNLVRKHPLPAVLIGFGIGLLLGRAARII